MSLLRSAMQLGSLELLTALVRFGRNILLARLLSVEDYGISNTYLIFLALMEAVTTIGLWQFVVRDAEGGTPRLLAAVQTMVLMRAVVICLLVLVLAEPLAQVFNQPDLVDTYRLLAVVPLLHGLVHIERVRRERGLDFGMSARVESISLTLSVVVMLALALVLRDHRLMLLVIVAEMAVKVLVSMWLAARPLEYRWDRGIAARALRFGWPLLLGAPIGFATVQGDRVIVANQFSIADLAQLSAALTLAATPTVLLARILGPLFFTALSRAQNSSEPAGRTILFAFEAQAVIGAVAALGIAIFGPAAMIVIFGQPFQPAASLMGLVGVLSVLPLLRGGFSSLSMSQGRTWEPLVASIPRLCAVVLAYQVAVAGMGVEAVLLVGIGGETLCIAVAMALYSWHAADAVLLRRLAVLYALALAVPGAVLWLHGTGTALLWGLPFPLPMSALMPAAPLLLLLWHCGELRMRLARAVGRSLRRLRPDR